MGLAPAAQARTVRRPGQEGRPYAAHALIYHGKFERNFSRLKPATRTFLTTDGRVLRLPKTRADRIRFGYMTRGKFDFVAVKAERIILREAVRLNSRRHSDGKGHAPSPTTFGDRSARRLLDDMIAANARQSADLRAFYTRLDTSEPVSGPVPSSARPPKQIRTKYYNPGIEALEGNPRLETHLGRERNRAQADAKKSATLDNTGVLRCEVCAFDFTKAYQGLAPFCEVHHRRALASDAVPTKKTLRDLAVLCANCHRAIHRTRRGWVSRRHDTHR